MANQLCRRLCCAMPQFPLLQNALGGGGEGGGGRGGQKMRLRHILAFKACRGAIKFGDPLSDVALACLFPI